MAGFPCPTTEAEVWGRSRHGKGALAAAIEAEQGGWVSERLGSWPCKRDNTGSHMSTLPLKRIEESALNDQKVSCLTLCLMKVPAPPWLPKA